MDTTQENKKIAILQSNYIPWKGYFELINVVDEFVLYDDMQYTRRDWRNRNKIKTANGLQWLTIPVDVKGKYDQKINETKIAEPGWAEKHWKTIDYSYRKSSCFNDQVGIIQAVYENMNETLLSKVNYQFIIAINKILGIDTKITWSSDYELAEGKTERLLGICQQAGASEYWSGPAAKGYMEVEKFNDAGIDVKWMKYDGYPVYPQLYGDFEHGVSILDLIFNMGSEAANFITSTEND